MLKLSEYDCIAAFMDGHFFGRNKLMRVGIVGAGSMGNTHAVGWSATDAELVGVVANRDGTGEGLAEKYGCKVYSNYETLLNDVDIIDICAPSDLHYEMVLKAAAAKKHIICEKPIALTVAHGQAMIDACNKAGVRLFIALVVRFIPEYSAAQQVVASGQIGKPGVIRLTRASYQPRKAKDNWFLDESRSGGMILDLMIHDYDYARWLAGDVTRVFAKSVRAGRPDAPTDYALVLLRFASGAIGHIEGGWAYPVGMFRVGMDIAGTDGVIEWHSDSTVTMRAHLHEVASGSVSDVALRVPISAEDPYTTEIKHFYDCLLHDKPFLVTPEDALAALEIGLAARESLKTGRPVTIKREA